MKLEVAFPELEALVRTMGAKGVRWKPNENLDPFEQIRQKLTLGVDVKLEDVQTLGGLLTYEGQQVLLYIRDNTRSENALNDPDARRRFHIAECTTIRTKRAQGTFERYVATANKTGLFKIDCNDGRGNLIVTECELFVCQNCLSFLNYKNFIMGDFGAVKNFDLNEFFGTYQTFFDSRPTRSDITAIPEKYVKNWSRLSEHIRQSVNWTCDRCRILLQKKSHRKWLHVHHRDGVKTNNAMSNLRVLCIECHAKEPGHQGLYIPEEAKELLTQMRRDQEATSIDDLK